MVIGEDYCRKLRSTRILCPVQKEPILALHTETPIVAHLEAIYDQQATRVTKQRRDEENEKQVEALHVEGRTE